MARYEHLLVFKLIYDFTVYFYKISRKFPKDIKYSLATEIKHYLDEIMKLIIIANDSSDKANFLSQSLQLLEIVKLKIRLLYSLEIINHKRYDFMARSLTEISKQLVAWKKWSQSSRK